MNNAEAHMTPPMQAIQRETRGQGLAQAVTVELAARITAEEFKPGDKLPTEAALMQLMGVSRTVVREAISRLQASGLVETRHGVGTFVAIPQPQGALGLNAATLRTLHDVIAVMELRVSLETEAAALAAARRTPAHLEGMRSALESFGQRLAQGGRAVQPDADFHSCIMKATGNIYFEEVFAALGATTVPRTRINTALLAEQGEEQYLTRTHHEHEDIFNAILRQDAEGARAAMRTHLTNSIERLRRVAALSQPEQV